MGRAFGLLAAIAAAPADAETPAEYAAATCPEAFARHAALWPPEDAVVDVAWREPAGIQETVERVELAAWIVSTYALIEDSIPLTVFVVREETPPDDWLPRYRESAARLAASIDLYTCLRPSDETLRGDRAGAFRSVAHSDCFVGGGVALVDAFDRPTVAEVRAAGRAAVAARVNCMEATP